MKRLLGLVLGMASLVAVASLVVLEAGAATRNVTVADNSFSDAVSGNSTTTINAGDAVQWNWTGSNPHTVDSTGAESFSSGAQQTTGSFSHTFNTVGSFTYICGVHGAAMTGTVVVQAAQAPTNTPPAPTNTPAAQATNTPAASASNTPAGTAAAATTTPSSTTPGAVPATPAAGSPAPSGTQSAGEGLPVAGTGTGSDGFPWPLMTVSAAIVGLIFAGAAALRVFRKPEL